MITKNKFVYQIIIKFSELSENLNTLIGNKLDNCLFLDLPFEVVKINNFIIKETKVTENNCISCKLMVFVDCINPEIGKIFEIETKDLVLSKTKNKYLFSKGRINIICESEENIYGKSVVSIKIEQNKIFFKHILCVAKIINV